MDNTFDIYESEQCMDQIEKESKWRKFRSKGKSFSNIQMKDFAEEFWIANRTVHRTNAYLKRYKEETGQYPTMYFYDGGSGQDLILTERGRDLMSITTKRVFGRASELMRMGNLDHLVLEMGKKEVKTLSPNMSAYCDSTIKRLLFVEKIKKHPQLVTISKNNNGQYTVYGFNEFEPAITRNVSNAFVYRDLRRLVMSAPEQEHYFFKDEHGKELWEAHQAANLLKQRILLRLNEMDGEWRFSITQKGFKFKKVGHKHVIFNISGVEKDVFIFGGYLGEIFDRIVRE